MFMPAQRYRSDLQPTFDNVQSYFEQGDLVPVYRTLLADLETPVSVYMKLTHAGKRAFLLESVEGGERVGRYSFIGVDPAGILSVQNREVVLRTKEGTQTRPLREGEDPLHVVEAYIRQFRPVKMPGLPRLIGGAVGFMAYDIVRHFEKLPATAVDELGVPDAMFMLVDTVVIFDHAKHQLLVLANAHNTGDPKAAYDKAAQRIEDIVNVLYQPLPPFAPPPTPLGDTLTSNMTQAQFEEAVRAAKVYIRNGDAFQIVLSQRFSQRTSASPLAIYRALRALNPSPYMFLLEFDDDLTLVGASPEVMVRLEDGTASVRPIAGTRKRGKTEAEDQALERELMADPKEIAEHVMLVDLGRNDLGRVCEYGTVKVREMMVVERYSHVMHIVSHVEGRLRPHLNAFDLLRATFPAGTLSGAPKVRAMEIIEELEGTRRGTYGGAVGYFSFDGSMDTCITIRTLLMRGDRVYLQAGAGLVADSDPTSEHQECLNKAKGVALALQYAESGLL
ncbi:anthranilate synthase component I [Aggregatilineales bacterium SYSU G02658]